MAARSDEPGELELGDTAIFSRVLYQLSYLAGPGPMLAAQPLRSPAARLADGVFK